MAFNTVVRATIDLEVKLQAAEVLADAGLTVSDVMRIALTKVAKEKVLPFEIETLNKLTVTTLQKSMNGEDVYKAKNTKELFDQLGI